MGFLLLQYEYQRASREVSVHQRAGIRLDNQVTRYTKRVEKMQSVFEKNKSKLENQFTTLQNNSAAALSNISSQIALGTGTQGQALTDAQRQMAYGYIQGQLGNIVIGGVPLLAFVNIGSITSANDPSSLMTALNTITTSARTALSNLITMVKEAETDKLEAQQDAQLTPIAEKEADLQAEKDLEDTLCTMWEQRRDNAKQKLPDAIQNGMAAYGIK